MEPTVECSGLQRFVWCRKRKIKHLRVLRAWTPGLARFHSWIRGHALQRGQPPLVHLLVARGQAPSWRSRSFLTPLRLSRARAFRRPSCLKNSSSKLRDMSGAHPSRRNAAACGDAGRRGTPVRTQSTATGTTCCQGAAARARTEAHLEHGIRSGAPWERTGGNGQQWQMDKGSCEREIDGRKRCAQFCDYGGWSGSHRATPVRRIRTRRAFWWNSGPLRRRSKIRQERPGHVVEQRIRTLHSFTGSRWSGTVPY